MRQSIYTLNVSNIESIQTKLANAITHCRKILDSTTVEIPAQLTPHKVQEEVIKANRWYTKYLFVQFFLLE